MNKYMNKSMIKCMNKSKKTCLHVRSLLASQSFPARVLVLLQTKYVLPIPPYANYIAL